MGNSTAPLTDGQNERLLQAIGKDRVQSFHDGPILALKELYKVMKSMNGMANAPDWWTAANDLNSICGFGQGLFQLKNNSFLTSLSQDIPWECLEEFVRQMYIGEKVTALEMAKYQIVFEFGHYGQQSLFVQLFFSNQ